MYADLHQRYVQYTYTSAPPFPSEVVRRSSQQDLQFPGKWALPSQTPHQLSQQWERRKLLPNCFWCNIIFHFKILDYFSTPTLQYVCKQINQMKSIISNNNDSV